MKNNTATDPIPTLHKAVADLNMFKKLDPELLKIYKRLGENPEDYKEPNCQMAVIGKRQNARQGDLIWYYNADIKKKTGKSWTLNPKQIYPGKYIESLWNTHKEILEIAGYPIAELAEEFGIQIKKDQDQDKNKDRTKFTILSRDNIGTINNRQTNDGRELQIVPSRGATE